MTPPRKFNNRNVLRQDRQPIELVGIATSVAPDLSSTDEARLYYDKTADEVYVSKEGGAYAAVPSGATSTELAKLAGITEYPLQVAERTFTETTGAGVYTGSVTLPAGATLIDIIIYCVAVWNTTTSATMKVGDVANDDGYFVDIDLKATDLVAAEAISFAFPGGKGGADLDAIDVGGEGGAAASANVHVRRRYLATARVISGIITSVGAAGTLGRTRMTVIFSLAVPTAATKVAS